MTASKCIRGKAAAGQVDPGKADEAARLFDEFEAELRHKNAPNPSEAAGQATADALRFEARARKRRNLQTIKAQSAARARVMANKDDALEAALSLLTFDPRRKIAGANVATTSDFVRGQTHAIMADFLERHRTKFAGLDVLAPGVRRRKAASLDKMVDELFGEASGDAEARAMAQAVSEGMEYQRRLFNASGGSIPKRADWGLPQSHNRRMIAAASKDEWVDFVFQRLDRAKMIDMRTGEPFGDESLSRILGEVYEDIVTDGLRDVKPGGATGRSVALRHQQHRFLAFRDAKAWKDYQRTYGEGDAFNTIIGHVASMSRDIGLMRVLGPNPDGTVRYLEQLIGEARSRAPIEETGPKASRKAARLLSGARQIQDVYASASGRISVPDNEFWSNVGAGNRNILASAMLGGAWFSAIADRTFSRITADLNGVPAMRVAAQHMNLFRPGSVADQKVAVQTGFIADGWTATALAQQRYFGEVIGPQWSQRIADTVLRATFLSPWTQAGRWAFGMEFLGFITRNAGEAFEDLSPALRRSFEAHGITSADWNVIRKTEPWSDTESGARFIRAQDIAGAIEDAGGLFHQRFEIAEKLQSMILTETEFAVPSATDRTRGLLLAGSRPGTIMGEILRNTALFKSFPVTLIQTHLRRAVAGRMTAGERARYVAHLVIGTAILGTLGEQMSQISKGRDPLPMDPRTEEGRKTMLKGLMRGGGLGIFGDFIFADQNRFGGGIGASLLGPVLGSQLPQFTKLTVGNMQELFLEGAMKNPGRELLRFVKTMTPGRSAWYGTLAFERLIFDEIQKLIDPNYAESFRAMERRASREFNQRYFAPPGRGLPRRGPELERAFQ